MYWIDDCRNNMPEGTNTSLIKQSVVVVVVAGSMIFLSSTDKSSGQILRRKNRMKPCAVSIMMNID